MSVIMPNGADAIPQIFLVPHEKDFEKKLIKLLPIQDADNRKIDLAICTIIAKSLAEPERDQLISLQQLDASMEKILNRLQCVAPTIIKINIKNLVWKCLPPVFSMQENLTQQIWDKACKKVCE